MERGQSLLEDAMITDEQRAVLAEILTYTEALYKIDLSVDPVSRTITVVYDDLDQEWFRELQEAS